MCSVQNQLLKKYVVCVKNRQALPSSTDCCGESMRVLRLPCRESALKRCRKPLSEGSLHICVGGLARSRLVHALVLPAPTVGVLKSRFEQLQLCLRYGGVDSLPTRRENRETSVRPRIFCDSQTRITYMRVQRDPSPSSSSPPSVHFIASVYYQSSKSHLPPPRFIKIGHAHEVCIILGAVIPYPA